MTTLLFYSVVFINLAFIFYTIGVWSEYIKKRLLIWHAVFFWLGVITDTLGTGLMIQHVGHIKFTLHTTTGFISLALMLVHAVWATWVLKQHKEESIKNFHKFSVLVWFIWFLSYLSGVYMGMQSIEA